MMHRFWMKAALLSGTALVALSLAGGCTYPGDTSGFKAENKPSKAEITQQIEQLKVNPNVPASVKAMGLKKLEKDLKTAQ